MACCGHKRHALRSPQRSDGSWVVLEYRARRGGPVEIHGVSGHHYVFSDATPIQTVHPRDARGMLRSGAFRMI